MSEFTLAHEHETMIPGPVPASTERKIYYVEGASDKMALEAYGTTVPTDGTTGFAPGCTFKKTDGGVGTVLYINEGTETSCDFNPVSAAAAYGTAAGRGPSPEIWDDCPVAEFTTNPQAGSYFFDDFMVGIDIATATATAAASALGTTGVWTGMTAATSNTVASDKDDVHGAITMSGTTDDQDIIIAYPKTAHIAGVFKFTADKKLWMECRLKTNVITDAISQLFIGFAEEGLVATTTLLTTSEGGPADKDYVAFTRKYAASHGEFLDTVFNTESGGTTPIEVGADAAELGANTYTKIGMYCDGTTLSFYQDGVVLADSVAIGATDFPIDEEMAFYISLMVGAAGATSTVTVDWVRIAQEY